MPPHLPQEVLDMLGIKDPHGGHGVGHTHAHGHGHDHPHEHGHHDHDHDHHHDHDHGHDHEHEHGSSSGSESGGEHGHDHSHEHERDPGAPRRVEREVPAYSPTLLVAVLCGMALREFGDRGFVFYPTVTLLVLCAIDLILRPLQKRGLIDTIHIAVYAIWTPQYLRGMLAMPNWFLRVYLAPRYHGKVLTHEHARELVAGNIDVPRCDVGENVLPYPRARELVLSAGDDIGLLDCPCRRARAPNNCKPTMVCMIMGSFVQSMANLYRGKPEIYRVIKRDEALVILEDEHKRGHVHVAWWKDIMSNQMFVLCNCCKCCCAGIEGMDRGIPMMSGSGYVASVNVDQCIGCGMCERTCAFHAIVVSEREVNGKKVRRASVDTGKCMGCGACEAKCPKHCIAIVRDEAKPEPLIVSHFQHLEW